MLRRLARLICLLLAIGLIAPAVPVAAAPTHHSEPMAPDCTMPDGCCDTGAPCPAACADRCLAMVPTAAGLARHATRATLHITRFDAGLPSHRHTPEPPVPRFS